MYTIGHYLLMQISYTLIYQIAQLIRILEQCSKRLMYFFRIIRVRFKL